MLSACASNPAPIEQRPAASAEPAPVVGIPPVPADGSAAGGSQPSSPPISSQPLPPNKPSEVPVVPTPPTLSREGVLALMPPKIADRNGWANDIHTAFSALHLPATRENLCAAMAVIEQESTWQGDPVVPGLSGMVWKQLYAKAGHYGVPEFAVNLAMLKTSPDGRSYKKRIDALRTEREMNGVYEDIVSELPEAARALGGKNPIRTGGPMQVSVEFAETQVKQKPYPYASRDTVRHEVFSRRGGTYFGIAMLLDYPVAYSQALYRFADYNAGRYSSRNVAFQQALARLSGKPLALDGDLLRYRDGQPSREPSETQAVLKSLGRSLGLDEAAQLRDLMHEKDAGLPLTPLWQKVFALAETRAGRTLPREALPQIRLQSPKITRKLTTEWFAHRVDGRYQACLQRAAAVSP